MWIAKATLLALWLFGFGTMALLYFSISRHLPPNSAVDVRSFTARTIHNPLWWAALVVCLIVGFAIARSMSVPLVLWIAVLVTGLIPLGCLALFLVLLHKLKHASPGHL